MDHNNTKVSFKLYFQTPKYQRLSWSGWSLTLRLAPCWLSRLIISIKFSSKPSMEGSIHGLQVNRKLHFREYRKQILANTRWGLWRKELRCPLKVTFVENQVGGRPDCCQHNCCLIELWPWGRWNTFRLLHQFGIISKGRLRSLYNNLK